jgi:hypothetical protein
MHAHMHAYRDILYRTTTSEIYQKKKKKEERRKKKEEFEWIFIEADRVLPTPTYKVVLDYLKYLGMWYSWSLRNGFLFAGVSGVSQHICRIKGQLFWQFSQVCFMGTLSLGEVRLMSSCNTAP